MLSSKCVCPSKYNVNYFNHLLLQFSIEVHSNLKSDLKACADSHHQDKLHSTKWKLVLITEIDKGVK